MMSTVFSSTKRWSGSTDDEADYYEDEDNSSTTTSSNRRISGDLDLPGAVITTNCVSAVIQPGSKQSRDPLQFVKIQTAELSKKAVEQIRLAEEVKITKEKIKEVEEEWQNNLLNWKSKRRQSRGNTIPQDIEEQTTVPRKIKTFQEILSEKAKSGHRIGYNLQRYISESGDEEEFINSLSIKDDEDQLRATQEGPNFHTNHENYDDDEKCGHDDRDDGEHRITDTWNHSDNEEEKVNPNSDNGQLRIHDNNKDSSDNDDRSQNDISSDYYLNSDIHTNNTSKNVWDYILQQGNQESNNRPGHHAISDDEDDQQNDSFEKNQTEEEQLRSFQAKLSVFESLAKNNNEEVLNPNIKANVSNQSKGHNGSKIYSSALNCTLNPPKKPPAVGDLAQKEQETAQKFTQRLQKNNIVLNSVPGNCVNSNNFYSEEIPKFGHRVTATNNGSKPVVKQTGPPPNPVFNTPKDFYNIDQNTHRNIVSSDQGLSKQYDQEQYYLLDDAYHGTKEELQAEINTKDKRLNLNCMDSSKVVHPQQPQQPRRQVDQQLPIVMNHEEESQIQNNVLKNGPLINPQQQQQHYRYYGPKPYNNQPQQKLSVKHNQVNRHQVPIQNLKNQHGFEVLRAPEQMYPQKSNVPQPQPSTYNRNHWLIQEAELRRQLSASNYSQQNHRPVAPPRITKPSPISVNHDQHLYENSHLTTQLPLQQQKQMLSVSGRKKCSNCGDELGRGCAAMVIESLSLYYHINCFRCSVCHIQLGNGTCGTDVRVRNHKLHCQNCYSNDEAGLKFSRV